MKKRKITLKVNGQIRSVTVDAHRFLLDVLRKDLGLTGVKYGCGRGECGACTVLLNGQPILSCLTLAIQVDRQEITTVEGLAHEGGLHPIQQAFVDNGAIQCGFCIPGMVLSAKALLDSNPNPTMEDVKLALSGNLCRCTGYVKIIDAVLEAARRLK